MPVENPEPVPLDKPGEGWQQLAHDARQNWDLEHPGVAALYENHVVPQLRGKGLGHLAISKEDESDATLLHNRDSKMHLLPDVEHSVDYLRQQGDKIPNEPVKKIAAYMSLAKSAEHIHDGVLTGNEESIARQVEARVMKAEEVPESYFEGMRRTFRDEGRGELTVTKEMRESAIGELQTAQRFSLEEWASYLGNTEQYSDGFKMYVWDSILKLKPYDPHKESFPKRSKGTVAPYPMFNQDAISKVSEAVEGGDTRSFANLYTEAVHSLDYFDPEILKTIEGNWRKFEESADQEAANELSDTLNEKTGWCVARESAAQHYLQSGDFWVYYTMGTDGEYTVPRAAIATTNGRIREIRGILPGQVLEPQMIDVAYSKATELPGGEKYLATREDMKFVTKIFNRIEKDPDSELSIKDLRFLYEFDRNIAKVDGNADPRINEIKQQRDWAADMLRLYDTQDHKELFRTILTAYDERKDMNILLSDKRRHPIFGYSLNREEKERERQKAFTKHQFNDMLENLPYLNLDFEAAAELIVQSDYYIPRVLSNAQSFGFADTADCTRYLLDKNHGSALIKAGYSAQDPQLGQDVLQVLLERGLERDILQSGREPSMRSAAIQQLASNLRVAEDVPDGAYKVEVKSKLVELFDGIKSGEKSQRVILSSLEEVTQFEQALRTYLETLSVSSTVFTPSKQRDMEIGLKQYAEPDRHRDGTATHLYSDVAIIDRADLRAGDLLFRNMSRQHPGKIVVSVATKPYPTSKLLQDGANISLLSRTEAESLGSEEAAKLYNELLAKEGMPEKLSDEIPVDPSDILSISEETDFDRVIR